jgi:hypothetical protein
VASSGNAGFGPGFALPVGRGGALLWRQWYEYQGLRLEERLKKPLTLFWKLDYKHADTGCRG